MGRLVVVLVVIVFTLFTIRIVVSVVVIEILCEQLFMLREGPIASLLIICAKEAR